MAVPGQEGGQYVATGLEPGSYEVTFNLSGFKPVTVRGVKLSVGEKQRVILLRDEGGALRGFSTVLQREVRVGGRMATMVFSGDTVIDRGTSSSPTSTACRDAGSRPWTGQRAGSATACAGTTR